MLADIPPLILKHSKPDTVYSITPEVMNCYSFDADLVPMIATTRYLNPREIFSWSPMTVAPNFWDIIKNQVHIFPSLYVDFGLVLSQQEIEYYIWNAYVDRSVDILEPVTVGDIGTTFVIDIAGDFTLLAGKGTPATLTVYTEGPISSSTDFQISVTPDGLSEIIYLLQTKATRVIVFPFWADWSKKVEFKLKFETVLSKTTQNEEQRRPLMSKPKRSISFSHLDITKGLLTNAINFSQDKSVGIPIVFEVFDVLDVSVGATSVTIHEKTSELWNLKRFCDYVILLEIKTNKMVAKKVISITENTISFENPVLEEFDSVSGVVGFPMIIGVFSSAKPTVLNGDLVYWDLSFSELIGENQPNLVGVPNLPARLDKVFNWEKPFDFEQILYRDIGEFLGTAQMVYSKFPLNKNTNKSYTGTFVFQSRAEIFSFFDFICGSKGRAKKFEYLIPLNEFQLFQGEYEGTNQLKVKNNFYYEQYNKVQNKKVKITYKNYTLETNINSVGYTSGYTVLTLNNSTSFRIYDEDCHLVRIEQYKTVRFDLDEFSIKCHSATVFSVDIRLVEVYS